MATKITPRKYDPSVCETVIELGKTGASQKMMFSHLGISYATAQTWKKNHAEFAEALDQAIVNSQAYWERTILENVGNKAFNSRIAEIALRGQFPTDYRERLDVKQEVKQEVVIDFNGAVNDLIKQLKDVT